MPADAGKPDPRAALVPPFVSHLTSPAHRLVARRSCSATSFRDDEPNRFASLFSDGRTVAVLSETTGGRLEQAARFRELLQGFGCTDELRAVLWAGRSPVGERVHLQR